ncbi:MAG: ABC transporter permease [Verrucomicrobia bacterium]|nr:ABC transporter permease [Verrucomicrobiota bacterium]
MIKKFSLFLALRYLKPKRSFVSVITLISVMGVALGVTLLLVVISVFTGYGERIKETILGFEPHIIVDSGQIMYDSDLLAEKIRKLPNVVSVSPFMRGQAVLDYQGQRLAPLLRGINPSPGPETDRLKKIISKKKGGDGEFDLDLDTVIIGDQMADALGVRIGDTITIFSPNIDAIMDAVDVFTDSASEEEKKAAFDSIRQFSLPKELIVTGIFNSGHYDFDSNVVFVHLETGQALYNLRDGVHGLAIQTSDGFLAHQVRDAIAEITGYNYRVASWMDIHKYIFDAVATERQAMYFLLFMIMIVAAFCIMNTMITVVYQKRAEIGVLKAIGASEGQVASLFLIQGMVVGVIGVISGLGLAALIITFRNAITSTIGRWFGIEIFSSQVYMIEGGLPAVVTSHDVIAISLGAFISCALASLAPAWLAARLEPAKSLRSE